MAEEKEKRTVGRPKSSTMITFAFKADGDLVPLMEQLRMEGNRRNRFLNEAVREKALREGLLKEVKNEKNGK